MEFAEGVVRAAWERQGGRCAKCGRWLIWAQRGRESMTGAWQPHHKDPVDQEKNDTLANCIIFCSGVADCHFNEGHAGINWSHYASLDDSRLIFLRAGEEAARRAPKALPTEKPSLVRAFLGASEAPPGKRHEAHRRRSKENRPEGAGAKGRKKAASGLGVASSQ